MKTLALVLAGVLAFALSSVPAEARGDFHPHVRIGVGLGFPYAYPYGWYDPWYDPWFYPWYGPYPARTSRDDKAAEQAAEKLFVYPAAGQTEAQTAQDRKECNDWAVKQSGLDPATAKRRAKVQHLGEYNRAFAACMEGRKYTVD